MLTVIPFAVLLSLAAPLWRNGYRDNVISALLFMAGWAATLLAYTLFFAWRDEGR